jgi:ComF family protein
MNTFLNSLGTSLAHIFFPHLCKGCGSEHVQANHHLCYQCIAALPYTNFAAHEGNPVEKTFFGRVRVTSATSLLYFTPSSRTKELVHQVKYKGQKQLARFLGTMVGRSITSSHRFKNIDHIIPLPLFKSRERQRGYNQAELLADGIADVTGIPVLRKAILRQKATVTQTHKSRTDRWANVEGHFIVAQPQLLANTSILLVDDVITTGATLDACASVLNNIPGTTLHISTLAFAMK